MCRRPLTTSVQCRETSNKSTSCGCYTPHGPWKNEGLTKKIVQHMGGSRWGTGGSKLGFIFNNGLDPLKKNDKATKPAFNVGPASARQ